MLFRLKYPQQKILGDYVHQMQNSYDEYSAIANDSAYLFNKLRTFSSIQALSQRELELICPNGILAWTNEQIIEHIAEISPQELRVLLVKKEWTGEQTETLRNALSPEQEVVLDSNFSMMSLVRGAAHPNYP